MNIHTQLKILALLCAFPLSNSFGAQPAQPNSLEAKLAAIDVLSDYEILSSVAPVSQEDAEQWLMNSKNDLKQEPFLAANQLPKKHAKTYRLAHKYWATHKELESCNNNDQKQYLQARRDGFDAQYNASFKEVQETTNSLIVSQTMPLAAYNYQVRRSSVYQLHASLLLAKNEKLQQKESLLQQEKDQLLSQCQQKEIQWQAKEAQLQQREQSLLAQLQEYKKQVNGQRIQDMADAPPPYEESSSSSK